MVSRKRCYIQQTFGVVPLLRCSCRNKAIKCSIKSYKVCNKIRTLARTLAQVFVRL